jgi:hypothetical protein
MADHLDVVRDQKWSSAGALKSLVGDRSHGKRKAFIDDRIPE